MPATGTHPVDPADAGSRLVKESKQSRKASAMAQPHSRTKELMARAKKIIALLEKDSPFFEMGEDAANRFPTFDEEEIVWGRKLGEGEYSNVHEIVVFRVPERCRCIFHGGGELGGDATSSTNPSTQGAEERGQQEQSANNSRSNDIEGADTLLDLSMMNMNEGMNTLQDLEELSANEGLQAEDEDRGFMKEHCFRDRSARYAIKQLKPNRTPEELSEAIVDIAMEAKFLSRLSHSNIIKMRGTGGIPCHPKYFLVLDRLYDTLEERIDKWAIEKKRLRGVMGVFGKKKFELRHLFSDRLLAALDIARALKYLHGKNIIFRDLKPENVGFDVRGDAKIFDFGLAKEFLPRDRVGPDEYKASGLTGSRRYMAPEVALCKTYGLSADVFSYSILLWEMISLKVPFSGFDVERHAAEVVNGGRRPKLYSKSWPVFLRSLMEKCWSHDPKDRPAFSGICDLVRGELIALEGSISHDIADRSKHLLDRSHSSRNGGE